MVIFFTLTTTFYILILKGYIVFDRCVFGFQINRVLKNKEIKNLLDYKIVHNFIEQTFDRNPDDMDNNKKIDLCNKMMMDYENKN